MFIFIYIVTIFCSIIVNANDPNQAVLDKFYQIDKKKVADTTGNVMNEVNANFSGECAAAIETHKENMGAWNHNTKKCYIFVTYNLDPQTNILIYGVAGLRQYRPLQGNNDPVIVSYSLPRYTVKDLNNKPLDELLKKCDIVNEQTISLMGSKKTRRSCVKFTDDNDYILLLRTRK